MNAHSAAVCQCNSRTPPAVSRILTPAIVLETSSSRTVTSRDQPPSCNRLWPKANGYLKVCTPPASVGGGFPAEGFCESRGEFTGPGSLALRSAPCATPCPAPRATDASGERNFATEFVPAAASAVEPTSKNP